PKLRMVINGDAEVNANRAEISASVRSTSTKYKNAAEKLAAASHHQPEQSDETGSTDEADRSRSHATDKALVSCFVHLESPEVAKTEALRRDERRDVQQDNLIVADLTPRDIESLMTGQRTSAYARKIAYVETGSPLSAPKPVTELRTSAKPTGRKLGTPRAIDQARVVVGIIDVGGFDFAHPDFLRSGEPRFRAIWDQGGPGAGTGAQGRIPEVRYGTVITPAMMKAAMKDADVAGVLPHDFMPQSSTRPGSHGTHVASIAAGNSGVCPEAHIVGVTIALSGDELERRSTFFDSTRLAHAVDFITEYAANVGLPVAINISLGTNGHAHDGTSPIARWIDTKLSRPGRCVCVAAGNSGQEAATFDGDIGYLSGRIHASGRIPARGLNADLEWQVVGNGIVDVSENEMEIWYRAGDEFCVQVRSPSGCESEWVGPGEFYENQPLPSKTFLSVYNERYLPANGQNRISIFLSPNLKSPINGIEAGTWTVRLKGIEVRDGRYDAWIERDDPRPLGRLGDSQAWLFPSYFSSTSNVDSNSVSSLACGRDVIAVGNADMSQDQIHVSSSQGPTWDGRPKPDIAAPGSDIVAANGFAGGEDRDMWVSKTGTSMASPYVTGVAAVMLAKERRLTAKQIAGIMRRTAQPFAGSDYQWQDAAGYGVIQAEECLERVAQPFAASDLGEDE
ncbi:MAG: S8 family serine peptidase, partial [Acidimicrobiia bacterium]|nr:S8 family serine peptidase [Acidimicrobiia bacterium]